MINSRLLITVILAAFYLGSPRVQAYSTNEVWLAGQIQSFDEKQIVIVAEGRTYEIPRDDVVLFAEIRAKQKIEIKVTADQLYAYLRKPGKKSQSARSS
jgi:hypothetical protein